MKHTEVDITVELIGSTDLGSGFGRWMEMWWRQ
jgi:hypothetical protein